MARAQHTGGGAPLIVGLILCATGVGAILGIPLLIASSMISINKSKMTSEVPVKIRNIEKQIAFKRATAATIRAQISSPYNLEPLPAPIQPNDLPFLPQQISPQPSPRTSPKKSNNVVPVLVVGSVLFIAFVILLVVVFLGLSKTGLLWQEQPPSTIASQPINTAVSPEKSYSDQMVPILAQLKSKSATWI